MYIKFSLLFSFDLCNNNKVYLLSCVSISGVEAPINDVVQFGRSCVWHITSLHAVIYYISIFLSGLNFV